MSATDLAPRPATEVVPPLQYMNPQRRFRSKTERAKANAAGESTLGEINYYSGYDYYNSLPSRSTGRSTSTSPRPASIWDPVQRRMVPMSEYERARPSGIPRAPQKVGSDPDVTDPALMEYHFRVGRGDCKIYTPCHDRPCTVEDHVDISGKVVRWKGTKVRLDEVETVELPPFRESHILGYPPGQPRPTSSRSNASRPTTAVTTATAPDLGTPTDVVPSYVIAADGTCTPITTPRLHLRGTKRFFGTLLPSFRSPS